MEPRKMSEFSNEFYLSSLRKAPKIFPRKMYLPIDNDIQSDTFAKGDNASNGTKQIRIKLQPKLDSMYESSFDLSNHFLFPKQLFELQLLPHKHHEEASHANNDNNGRFASPSACVITTASLRY
mmetsp:Transcript_3115/g.4738  ORF Transcript_3115/g.4738 Transcript_3115/m.4738 type:complete len:124 (-) Transcript_3115:274-645(-)